uniref:Lipase domain-containing protein n=1 Tax=Romanomermis culicivorax TaxID=13658 RepID=A0A915KEW0_ROMCU
MLTGLKSTLDPAGPFFDCHPDIGLTKNSAQQVQVLHTDFVGLSRYGTNMDRGHIDYYVNKDRGVQPGCPPTTPPVPLVDPFTTFRLVFRIVDLETYKKNYGS